MATERTVSVKLLAKVDSYKRDMTAAANATKQFGVDAAKHLRSTTDELASVRTEATVAGAALLALPIAATAAVMGFDKQMSKVGAVAGATAAQMDKLRTAAIEAGRDTAFSASDAAAAEAELAKAGVSVADILGGGLKGSLDLAAAGELSVADAATIAATTMVQFGKSGRDVGHIADLLAAASNKAQGGVQDMAGALKFVGPVASQMGVSLEQTTGTIAELASQGILGEQAGTSLRGMLTALTSPSKIAADTMGQLGISVYDTQGKFIGFDGVAGQLHDRLGGLTAAERDEALGRIFGNEQITAARVLYAGGAAGVQKWTRAVDDSGAASRMAGQMMDNLAGDVEQLKGSIETGLIQAGSGANGVLRFMTQRATDVANAVSEVPSPILAIGLAASTAAGGFLLLAPRISDTIDAISKMKKAGGWGGLAKGAAGTAAAAAVLAVGTSALSAAHDMDELIAKGAELDKAFGGTMPKDNKLSDLARQAQDNAEAIATQLDGTGNAVSRFWNAVINGSGAAFSGDSLNPLTNIGDRVRALEEAQRRGAGEAATYNAMLGDLAWKLGTTGSAAADLADQAVAAGVQMTGSYHDQADAVVEWSKTTNAGQEAVRISMAQTGDAMSALTDRVLGAFGLLDARGKERTFQAAIDAATESLKKNGQTLDVHTAKGRDNAAALDDIAAKTLALATSKDKEGNVTVTNTRALERGAVAYYNMARRMGLSSSAAETLTEKVTGVQIKVDKFGQAHATAKLSVSTASAETKLSTFEQQWKDAISRMSTAALNAHFGVTASVGAHADGGLLRGAGTGRSDSMLIRASNGEFVVNAAATSRNLPLLEAINSGSIPGFASGGRVLTPYEQQAHDAKTVARARYLERHLPGLSRESRDRLASMSPDDRLSIDRKLTSGGRRAVRQFNAATLALSADDRGRQAREDAERAKQEKADKIAGLKEQRAQAADSVSQSIQSANSLTGSFDFKAQVSALNDLTAAKKAQTDAENDYFAARKAVNTAGTPEDQARAAQQLADAEKALAEAKQQVATAQQAVADTAVTPGNIIKKYQSKLAALSSFRSNIETLARRGLNPATLQELISAGVDGGAEMAAALVQMTPEQLGTINATQAQIATQSDWLGQLSANLTYNPQIAAAGGRPGVLIPTPPSTPAMPQTITVQAVVGDRVLADATVAYSRRTGGFVPAG